MSGLTTLKDILFHNSLKMRKVLLLSCIFFSFPLINPRKNAGKKKTKVTLSSFLYDRLW